MKSDSYLARKRTGANSDTLVAKYAAYELYFRKYFRTSYIPSYIQRCTKVRKYESTFESTFESTTRDTFVRKYFRTFVRKYTYNALRDVTCMCTCTTYFQESVKSISVQLYQEYYCSPTSLPRIWRRRFRSFVYVYTPIIQ